MTTPTFEEEWAKAERMIEWSVLTSLIVAGVAVILWVLWGLCLTAAQQFCFWGGCTLLSSIGIMMLVADRFP